MAEIHVQTKKSSGNTMWLWIVLAIIIIAAVAYYLINRNKTGTTVTPPTNTTGAIQYFVERINGKHFLLQDHTVMQQCLINIREPKALLS